MPRRGHAQKRVIKPDPVYGSILVQKLIDKVLLDGKKGLAERIVYGAMEIIEREKGGEPIALLKQAVENVRPFLEVKPRRVGGATYQVPIEVSSERGVTLALRWIVNFTRQRKEKTMADRLAAEIKDALARTGFSIKKREDLHRMAEGNKAFAHYRW